ncbi:MAG: X-Pro dipeptidyl-peptidase [Acidobacteria bacterium]|nr:MAG: X-Pro dipeptidyl-peptidase [Acidobacteriota bacterium]
MNNSWRRAVLRAATCGAIGIVLVPGGYRVRAQETEDAAAKEAVKSAAEIRARYTKYEFRIPMRDGAKLFTAVYLPKDAAPSKKYPFLIERTPYSVRPYGADNYPKRLGPARSFVADGFIFVYQDVRGRFQSEGKFIEVTPHKEVKKGTQDVDESTDTYDTIDWLLKNVPNNNGKAGIYGISYPGFYAAAGMPDSHPALKACSPQAPVTDLYMGDDAYHNGAFMLEANFGFYTFFKPRAGLEYPPKAWDNFDYGTNDGYDFYLAMGPLSNAKKLYLKDSNFYWDDQVRHPNYDEFWKSRNISAHMKNVHCAVMTVGGLFDAEDLQGPYKIFNSVATMSPDTPNRIVEGPWVHGGWAYTNGDHLGPVNFAGDNSAYFNDQVLLPFFQQYLKDAGDAKLPSALIFETGTNVWRRYETWPPKNTQTKTLFLQSGGTLTFEPANEKPGYDEYVSDPSHPIPFVETQSTSVPQTYMDADQRFASKRPDVEVYQTEPLEEDITVTGSVSPKLWVSSSGTDSDFVVKLIDVYPMNYPDPVPNPRDVHMGGYQQLVRGEPFRAKFRNSFEKPEPLQSNKPTAIHFDLPSINHTFRRGHRIMVQIQSTWFPLIDRNPQKFLNIPDAKPEDFQKATQRVYRGGEHASAIVLPVLK